MKAQPIQFEKRAHLAIHDPNLQKALANLKTGFVKKRSLALAALGNFESLRKQAVQIKDHTLHHLDRYLEQFETEVKKTGGQVHWAGQAQEACEVILNICRAAEARLIIKSKSMLTEEIGLNAFLSKAGLEVTETDLGEYIIQKRHEAPSHIVAPAIHLVQSQIAKTFYQTHTQLNPTRNLNEPLQLLDEARTILRKKYFLADVGITGANFLIADTGSVVLLTNEGNAELTLTLPKIHIVVASIEKVLPSFEYTTPFIRLLPRSATGQAITAYTSFITGSKYKKLGSEAFHVILIDNGRSKLLGTEWESILRCIRCGACLNHCPVYETVGGQTYGSVYPGPMGAVLSPGLFGLKLHRDLPNASTFCGQCENVCPVHIPLPQLMRSYREREFNERFNSLATRIALKLFNFLAQRPRLYHFFTASLNRMLRILNLRAHRLYRLPFISEWTRYRDFPAPAEKTFHQLWKKKNEYA